MSFFKQAKPRRFQPSPLYYDERKELLRKIKENAGSKIGVEKDEQKEAKTTSISPTDDESRYFSRRRNRTSSGLLLHIAAGVLLVLMVYFFLLALI